MTKAESSQSVSAYDATVELLGFDLVTCVEVQVDGLLCNFGLPYIVIK